MVAVGLETAKALPVFQCV